MPIVHDDRRLATVESINSITPIENADAIETARVRGWNVVVKKGEFKPGDIVIFFEIDTALPLDDPRFSFLAQRSSKNVDGRDYHILKTARLRGVYSQGLVLPLSQFPGIANTLGEDVTEALGLGKFEPPMDAKGGTQKGSFLVQFANKTDAERIQNLGTTWDELTKHEWEPTLKVDGTSLTVARDENGDLRVMSRNWEMNHDGSSVYSRIVEKYSDVFDTLNTGEVVQAEIVGPGIQNNRLGLTDITFMVFSFIKDREYMPRSAWPEKVLAHAVPVLDVEFPSSPDGALAQVEGMKYNGRQIEGIVWHTVNGESLDILGGRNVWKAINNKYLLKD